MPMHASIAVVGRPNVGKSTLVNLLSGRAVSVVADTPAVTRDRVVVEARIGARPVNLIDTGGFTIDPKDNVAALVMEQLHLAIEESDLIVCLFDASEPPTLLDEEIVRRLRKRGRPVLYAANKADRKRSLDEIHAYEALGLPAILPISAAHNTGIRALLEEIGRALPPPSGGEEDAGASRFDARILILGRPNAGKSTLINTAVGDERVIVDPVPGTTRDCIEIASTVAGRSVLLVDSAGIRRPRSVQHYLEELSVIRAIKAIGSVDVAVMLVDAPDGMVQQDERIAGMVLHRGKGLVIGLNKWDRMRKVRLEEYMRGIYALGEYLSFVPAVPLSALTGWNVGELFKAAFAVREALGARISTSRLNRFLSDIVARHAPPRSGGRPVRIYYVAQTGMNPPAFSFVSNRPDAVTENWRKYAAAQLRQAFGFNGVPLRLRFRPKKRPPRP